MCPPGGPGASGSQHTQPGGGRAFDQAEGPAGSGMCQASMEPHASTRWSRRTDGAADSSGPGAWASGRPVSASQRTPASIQSALELTMRVGNSGAENGLFVFVFQDPPRGGWQGCGPRPWPWRGKAGFQVARGCALAGLCTHARLGPRAAPPQRGRPRWPPVARVLARGGWTVWPAKATGTFPVTARLPRTALPRPSPAWTCRSSMASGVLSGGAGPSA